VAAYGLALLHCVDVFDHTGMFLAYHLFYRICAFVNLEQRKSRGLFSSSTRRLVRRSCDMVFGDSPDTYRSGGDLVILR
jgi:hypothetical protein